MTSALPGPAIPPLKSRRGWLIAFGVLEILIGCFCLLLTAATLLMPTAPEAPPLSPNLKIFVSLVYSAVAAMFLVIGVGSIRCQNWARLAMIGISWFWLATGVFSLAGFILIFPLIRQQSRLPPEAERMVLAITLGFMGIVFVCLPVVFLIFYSLKSVKATCQAGTADEPAVVPVPGRGLVITLAIWEGCHALAVFSFLSVHATVLFGVVIHGLPAFLILLVHSAASALSAWLIFRRRFIGWSLALWKMIFWMASLAVTLSVFDTMQLNRQMGLDEKQLEILQQIPYFQSMLWISTLVTMGSFLVFLMYTRKYFTR